MILFLPRLRLASLSAETRRLSAEMKIPSTEMEKSWASALKDGVTKRGKSRMMLTSILYDFCYDSSQRIIATSKILATSNRPGPSPHRKGISV